MKNLFIILISGLLLYGTLEARFFSIDPKWAEQPAWSPYHYSQNNPINAKDPNGEYLEFYQGNEELSIPATSAKGIKNYELAKVYLNFFSYSGRNEIINQIEVSPLKFTLLVDDNSIYTNLFDHTGQVYGEPNLIAWSSEAGWITNDGGRQTPANGLLHEFGHSSAFLSNPKQYLKNLNTPTLLPLDNSDMEELRNLEETENPFSKYSREAIRKTYYDGKYFQSESPISIEKKK